MLPITDYQKRIMIFINQKGVVDLDAIAHHFYSEIPKEAFSSALNFLINNDLIERDKPEPFLHYRLSELGKQYLVAALNKNEQADQSLKIRRAISTPDILPTMHPKAKMSKTLISIWIGVITTIIGGLIVWLITEYIHRKK